MARTSIWVRGLATAMAVVLTLFSVGFSYAVVSDYSSRGRLPQGARIDGVAVGGLSRAEALAVVHEKVEAPLVKRLALKAGKRTLTLDPARIVSVEVTGMVESAFAPERKLSFTDRLYRRVTNAPARIAVRRSMTVDKKALARWVSAGAGRARIAPVDATVESHGDRISISASRPGQALDRKRALALLGGALKGTRQASSLPVVTLRPKVTEAAFARVILVDRSRCRLTLFHGERKVKSYSVAVGQPAYPTPRGTFHVEGKEMWPTWVNPGSGWASGMPQSIPPGPGNPLGSRAIAIDSPGVRIHGTSNDGSIGSAASHGCMRMHMWDVEDLYPRVRVGDTVIIK